LPLIVPENPDYKDAAGTALLRYVWLIIGARAPKITGMLIDLPIDDIRTIM